MLAGYYRAEPAVHQYWSLYWQDTGEPCQRCTNTKPCVGGVLPSRASGAPILTLVYIAFCWSLGFVHPVQLITSCFAPDNSRHLLALYLLYHVLFSLSARHVLLSPCSMHVLSCYHVWMSHGRGAGEPGRDAHGCLRSESWYGSVRACAVCQILLTLILKLTVWNRNLWVHIKLSVLMFIYYRTPLHGHPLNMDTSLLWSLFFVPRENPCIFFKFNPLNTEIR